MNPKVKKYIKDGLILINQYLIKKPSNKPINPKDYEHIKTLPEAQKYLDKLVKKYHHHSSVIKINSQRIKTRNKLPKIFWNKQILRIVLYQFDCFSATRLKDHQLVVQTVQQAIENHPSAMGYIIDLRNNLGGFIIPMIESCADLLGEGHLYSFESPDKKTIGHVSLKKKKVVYQLKITKKKLFSRTISPEQKKIAIIIGKNTCSAGEIFALCFYDLSKIKYFGQKTRGLLSANTTKTLDKGKTFFHLTSAYVQTKNKTHLKQKVFPNLKTKKPISEAQKWIFNK